MKPVLFLFILLCSTFVNAQIVSIPDANFKAKLLQAGTNNIIIAKDLNGNYLKIDANGDGQIQVSEALQVSFLNVSNSSIASLKGIEYFTNLLYLQCHINTLSELVVSTLTKLKTLICYNNKISSLNITDLSDLESLLCSANLISSLNVAGHSNLKSLVISYNPITRLDVSGLTNLEVLNCSALELTSLNLSGLTNLKTLLCSENQIPVLDIHTLTKLEKLDCQSNLITSLNLDGATNLKELYCNINAIPTLNFSDSAQINMLDCSQNKLKSLDLTTLSNLRFVNCAANQLTSLKVSGLKNLEGIYCGGNQLQILDFSGLVHLHAIHCDYNPLLALNVDGLVNLVSLWCQINKLTTLDVSTLVNLNDLQCANNSLNSLFIKNGKQIEILEFYNNPMLKYICADDAQFQQIQDKIVRYGITDCHINSYCSFTPGGSFYVIECGNTYDANNNGCDTTDTALPFQKYTITKNGATGSLIANSTGEYSIPVQAGIYTLAPAMEYPAYFNIRPESVTINFPSQPGPVVQHFCIEANGIHPDLEITLIPLTAAQPGFYSDYKLLYRNKGTIVQSGSAKLIFDGSVLDFANAVPPADVQLTHSIVWNFSSLQPFESREIHATLKLNSPVEIPALNGGDTLRLVAKINSETDESPTDNVAELTQVVVNSLDPNDKTCLEGTRILPGKVGSYLHYLIRFENTGTTDAVNVVVRDQINSSMFDISSLVPTDASHPFYTRITDGNIVEFIFENIRLPFDDRNNHGYVAFKIKTLPGATVFTNKAEIYFDFNLPIETNYTETKVSTFSSSQEKEMEQTTTRVFPNPVKDILYLEIENQIEKAEIYDISGRLLKLFPSPDNQINVSDLKSGLYLLKVFIAGASEQQKIIKD